MESEGGNGSNAVFRLCQRMIVVPRRARYIQVSRHLTLAHYPTKLHPWCQGKMNLLLLEKRCQFLCDNV